MKIVEIGWVDSVAFSGWKEHKSAVEEVSKDDGMHYSTGYLIVDTETALGLAQSYGGGSVGDIIRIPKGTVKFVHTIREDDGEDNEVCENCMCGHEAHEPDHREVSAPPPQPIPAYPNPMIYPPTVGTTTSSNGMSILVT